MFAHIYCPNLLVQCERLFQPERRSQALIIYESITHKGSEHISLVACSSQARELGFEMSLGSEQLGQLIEQFSVKQDSQTLVQCRPNKELYADMSERLFSALEMLAPSVAPIASDEACIDLAKHKLLKNLNRSGIKPPEELTHEVVQQLQDFAIELRHSIQQWLGLEIFVGLGSTKTLAYLGCKAAEIEFDQGSYRTGSTSMNMFAESLAVNFAESLAVNKGTAVLSNADFDQPILARFPTSRIRGISSKALSKLSALGIHTALELSQASSHLIGKHCSVLVEHIAIELSGLTSQLRSEQFESKQFSSKNSALCMAKTKPAITQVGSEIQQHLANYTKARLKARIKGQSSNGVSTALLRILITMLSNAHKELITRQLNCHKLEIVLERSEQHVQDKTFADCKSISLAVPSDTLGTIKKLSREILESMVCESAHYSTVSLRLICQDQDKAKQAGLFEAVDEVKKITQSLDTGRQTNTVHQYTLVQRYCELEDLLIQKKNPHNHNHLPKSPSYTSQWHELLRVS